MANPEHLEILKQGVEVWNKWRDGNPDINPDLTMSSLNDVKLPGANLSSTSFIGSNLRYAIMNESDLRGAYLTAVDASHANLAYANCSEVSFSGANLSSAFLEGAKLDGAQLDQVDLSNATLRNVSLTRALLRSVNLSEACLDGTDLSGAKIKGLRFGANDLRVLLGLEDVFHLGPSTIGVDTIFLSEGRIPEAFLRGCGVPESFIAQLPTLVAATQPIQFYTCFVSYSSKDQEFAERFHADLQNRGVRCWFAPEDLKIGDRFRDRIDESIRLHDKLLLILSEHSVSSPWVGDEVEAAIEREHRERRTVLFPIKIDDAVAESEQAWAAAVRRTRHIGDFIRWKDHDSYQMAFERLLRDLKAEGKKS